MVHHQLSCINNNNNTEESNQGSNMYQTWKAIMANFALSEERFQGIYYKVHVECSNPEIPKVEPLVFMSDDNLPQHGNWSSSFQSRFHQLGKWKRVAKELHGEALAAQQILQEVFLAKKDEYKVTVEKCQR